MTTDYIKLSNTTYFSNHTGRLLTESQLRNPRSVLVPWYVPSGSDNTAKSFSLSRGSAQLLYNQETKSNSFQIGNYWSIQRLDLLDYQLQWLDRRKNMRRSLVWHSSTSSSTAGYVLQSVSMSLDGGELVNDTYAFSIRQMRSVMGMTQRTYRYKSGTVFVLNSGLVNAQFNIGYNRHVFAGTCYLFVIDSYFGILLKDDLEVDAIVLLNGIQSKEARDGGDFVGYPKSFRLGYSAIIHKVIWTDNPYISKQVFLYGNK